MSTVPDETPEVVKKGKWLLIIGLFIMGFLIMGLFIMGFFMSLLILATNCALQFQENWSLLKTD